MALLADIDYEDETISVALNPDEGIECIRETVSEVLGVPAHRIRLQDADQNPLQKGTARENGLKHGSEVFVELVPLDLKQEQARIEDRILSLLKENAEIRERLRDLEANSSHSLGDQPPRFVLLTFPDAPRRGPYLFPMKKFHAAFEKLDDNPHETWVRFRKDFAQDRVSFLAGHEYDTRRGDFRADKSFWCVGTYRLHFPKESAFAQRHR